MADLHFTSNYWIGQATVGGGGGASYATRDATYQDLTGVDNVYVDAGATLYLVRETADYNIILQAAKNLICDGDFYTMTSATEDDAVGVTDKIYFGGTSGSKIAWLYFYGRARCSYIEFMRDSGGSATATGKLDVWGRGFYLYNGALGDTGTTGALYTHGGNMYFRDCYMGGVSYSVQPIGGGDLWFEDCTWKNVASSFYRLAGYGGRLNFIGTQTNMGGFTALGVLDVAVVRYWHRIDPLIQDSGASPLTDMAVYVRTLVQPSQEMEIPLSQSGVTDATGYIEVGQFGYNDYLLGCEREHIYKGASSNWLTGLQSVITYSGYELWIVDPAGNYVAQRDTNTMTGDYTPTITMVANTSPSPIRGDGGTF